ncbi:hypothetical protein [Priestia endophytica]|uniref:hypothetical protein n=1 Tax=Priestia endophytica TaxID=135735 RepID=UPI00227F652C|nr:hypothetical protein [Priestia endophytica]MCY8235042.1 hypothetical protein [Priestia endophytica]
MYHGNPVLEYRLLKGEEFEALYFYENIEIEQIIARRECEFFVKQGITYKQTSSALEGSLFIIYVEEYEKGEILNVDRASLDSLKLEIREYAPDQDHPILKVEYFQNHLDVFCVIGSVYTYIEDVEWERDSAEIDEDRRIYSLYVTKVTDNLSQKGVYHEKN